jgi:hypothetical protein
MSLIRACSPEDMPAVAGLFQKTFLNGRGRAPKSLESYLAELFLRHPWYDPELPSRVGRGGGARVHRCAAAAHVLSRQENPRRDRWIADGRQARGKSARGRALAAILRQWPARAFHQRERQPRFGEHVVETRRPHCAVREPGMAAHPAAGGRGARICARMVRPGRPAAAPRHK